MPNSTRLHPRAARRRITSAVKSRSGSPAVTNGMNALRPEERSWRKSVSMADMEGMMD